MALWITLTFTENRPVFTLTAWVTRSEDDRAAKRLSKAGKEQFPTYREVVNYLLKSTIPALAKQKLIQRLQFWGRLQRRHQYSLRISFARRPFVAGTLIWGAHQLNFLQWLTCQHLEGSKNILGSQTKSAPYWNCSGGWHATETGMRSSKFSDDTKSKKSF